MAKRLLGMILTTIVGIYMAKADDSLLVYDGITPSPGSEISSFDFVLHFDISKIIESNGDGDYGIGWTGYHNDKRLDNEKSIAIYQGDPTDGVVIGRVCDSNNNGSKSGFEASSDVNVNIEGVIPEPGVIYTMVITNQFSVYATGSSSKLATFDCFTNPITYTFTGAATSTDNLTITGCSISANQVINELIEITFSFSQQISVNSEVPVKVLEDDVIYAQSTNAVLSDDKMSVTYYFDNTALILNNSYIISLPAGAVYSAENSSATNTTFNIPVVGDYVNYFQLKSSTPNSGEKAIFSSVTGIFDMPDGFQVYKKSDYSINFSAQLYKEEIADDNLLATLTGTYNNDRNGIVWSYSGTLEPETKYILYKPEREFRAYEVSTDKFSSEWYNGEVTIVLYTPSIEEAGYAPIEWGNAIIGTHGESTVELKDGDTVESLEIIEIAPDGYFYTCSNGQFRLGKSDTDNHYGYLYDVTTETPELISEVKLSYVYREQTMFNYYAISAPLRSVFYEGHKYRFVIPKDEYTIVYPPLYNYVRTEEYSVEFNGSTPTEAKLLSCTLQEGEERSSLCNIVWIFKGSFELNEDSKALLNGSGGISKYDLTSSLNSSGNTVVMAHIYSNQTGEPLGLYANQDWTLTLPEGTVYNQTDSSIKNEEITISFRSVEASSEVQEPEFINAEVNVNGFHTTTLEAVKDRQLNVGLIPDDNWKVTSLTRDGNDVLPFLEAGDGIYTTPALTADTKIEATVEYDGVIINDIASDVVEIPDSTVKVYSDGEHIVVDGINVGDVVAVYSTNGMLIAQQTMNASNRAMQISITKGQVYIVRVNDTAVKIKH